MLNAKQHFLVCLALCLGLLAFNSPANADQPNADQQEPAATPPAVGEPPHPMPEPDEPPPAAPEPTIRHLGDGVYQIGEITLDRATREIRVPAIVNMNEGEIEFPLTHEQGRLHEAIFATTALPFHFEIALRLLHYEPSKEVFPRWPHVDQENPPPWNEWPPPVFDEENPRSHVLVIGQWEENGETVERPLTEMVQQFLDADGEETRRLDNYAGYWVYTGSEERMTEQIPELGGAFVGIRPELACSINTLPDEAIHYLPWFAVPENIPPIDTEATVIIRPAPQNVVEDDSEPAATDGEPTPENDEN